MKKIFVNIKEVIISSVILSGAILIASIIYFHNSVSAQEVSPWCANPNANLYNAPFLSSNLSYIGPIAPSSCANNLGTDSPQAGYCPLSPNLVTLFNQVGQSTGTPPALLAAEKQIESGNPCNFNETSNGNTSISAISLLTDNVVSSTGAIGPYQFEPSTWSGYVNGVSDIINSSYQFAVSIGVHINVFLDSMIGAGLKLSDNSNHPQVWTKQDIINSAASYYCGAGYLSDTGSLLQSCYNYANSVYAYYLGFLDNCFYQSVSL